MEYLSLQDIPHRQYDSLHSHRMAPSHSSERSLGSMAAAVSQDPENPSSSSNHLSSGRGGHHSNSSLPLLPPPHTFTSSTTRHKHYTRGSTWTHSSSPHSLSMPPIQAPHLPADPRPMSSSSMENDLSNLFLTHSQNAQMRSSPPIQPNERGYADKLPSFSEVCYRYSSDVPAILICKVSRYNTRTYPATNSVSQARLQ
jgi:hypothetical protein